MPAEFYKGFVFERNVQAPNTLTIEGIPIQYCCGPNGLLTVEVFGSKKTGHATTASGSKPTQLARDYIKKSQALRIRESEKAKHLKHLLKGSKAWNQWRRANPLVQPMLADLTAGERDLLKRVKDLTHCDFSYANLCGARLQGLHLEYANFHQAILAAANLSGAHLEHANFCRTDFYSTVLRGAWLNGANLQGVQLAMTDLTGAHLTSCKVYGLSAWDLNLAGADQSDFVIKYKATASRKEERGGRSRKKTPKTTRTRMKEEKEDEDEEVRVSSLDLAAFMYMTLNNGNISRIIDEAGRRWVLLLGRFSRRKHVLLKLKDTLKDRGYVPVIFDFPQPNQRDLLETIMLLGGLSAFVIAEITDPRSSPMEVLAIASNFGVPIFPILEKGTRRGNREVSTFAGLRKFSWVLPTLEYNDTDTLLQLLQHEIVAPAMAMRRDIANRSGVRPWSAG